MNYKLLINNVDYTQHLTLPTSIQQTLDESLNVGYIRLVGLKRAEAFKPFTAVKIEIDTQVYSLFVSSDEVTSILSRYRYNHSITLIEQSKWLERFTGIVKTNTKTLATESIKKQDYSPIMVTNSDGYTKPANILGQQVTTEKLRYFITKLNPTDLSTTSDLLTADTGEDFFKSIGLETPASKFIKAEILYEDEVVKTQTSYTNVMYADNGSGKYEVRYYLTTGDYFSYTIGCFASIEEIKYTITDVINNLLRNAICLNVNETPLFALNAEQATEFEKIEAPDFSLIGTLWECLSEIGGYLHAIPRLEDNVIYFDKLGGMKQSESTLNLWCSEIKRFDIEQYATHLDSIVENLVNTDNKAQGTITAPFNSGYKTVRTETGIVQLTSDNIFIKTREPIEELISLECGYISDGRLVGDITPYVFESAEYQALSAYGGEFPFSRGYALQYTQGRENITELNFKIPNAVSSVFSRPAIINIIARELGVDPESIKNENLMNLQFRVKYIPIVSARVQQSKGAIADLGTYSSLEFNQSANKINSVAYGENMKGTLARLGNPEIAKVFVLRDLAYIPKVGDLYDDDYYVSVVKLEFYKKFYKCEIILSKDFNKLNEYVGIKSEKRFYEISEKQAVDRYVNYQDYCVISNGEFKGGDKQCLITNKGLTEFGEQFKDKANKVNSVVDSVIAQGRSIEDGKLKKLILPVTSLGMGNAMIFNYHYDDNFSGGDTRQEKNNTLLQYQTRYTDIYGRIKSLDLRFAKTLYTPSNYNEAVEIGNKLPIYDNLAVDEIFNTDKANIIIDKDNRENINFTYQVNFIANDNTYVIGSALTKKSTFVTSDITNYKIYTLPNKINKFADKIDLTNATLVLNGINEVTYDTERQALSFGGFDATQPAQAWVLVNDKNELVLGQNTRIIQNERIKDISFVFTHKIKQGE